MSRLRRLNAALNLPGGRLVIWEFHPIAECIGADADLAADYPFSPVIEHYQGGVSDYVGTTRDYALLSRVESRGAAYQNLFPTATRRWSLAQVVNALVPDGAYLLSSLDEFDFSWEERIRPWLGNQDDRRFVASETQECLPLTVLITGVAC